MMLIGNKNDLEHKRGVSFEDGKALADEFNMNFLETSAAEEVNIDQAFRDMAKVILEKAPADDNKESEKKFNELLALESNAHHRFGRKCCI